MTISGGRLHTFIFRISLWLPASRRFESKGWARGRWDRHLIGPRRENQSQRCRDDRELNKFNSFHFFYWMGTASLTASFRDRK
jgi:hypothetical protein